MRKNFNGPKEFQGFFKSKYKTGASKREEIIEKSLFEMSEFIKEKAQEKFGHYQTGWDQLADATQKERERKGYLPNEPLLRDGTLRDSIETTVEGKQAFVGSKNEVMVWQEKGTSRTGWGRGIPPRPVFLLTQIQGEKEATSIFFKTFIGLFRGSL